MNSMFQKRYLFLTLLCVAGVVCVINSCTKLSPVYSLTKPDTTPDTTNDIRKALSNIPNCSLFMQAFKRAGMADQVSPGSFYTIFAPSDSAMKAEGYTGDVINTLAVDSLKKIVKYHVTLGALSDTTLAAAEISVKQNCLLDSSFYASSTGFKTYIYSLYVKMYGGKLSINGWFVNNGGVPVKAANGYIYSINLVLQPPVQLLWDVIAGKPELSYYRAAINIIDSIYNVKLGWQASGVDDSVLFNQLRFVVNAANTTSPYPALFAPTNTAFINAGFPDIDSIRTKIVNSIKPYATYSTPYGDISYQVPGSGQWIVNGSVGYTTYYLPFDSIMKMHYLLNVDQSGGFGIGGTSFAVLLSYTDFTGCPNINNGIYNYSTTNDQRTTGNNVCLTPYHLQFFPKSGALNIQWNSGGTNNAVVYPDANQMTRSKNFWVMNGVLYECDQLFYTK